MTITIDTLKKTFNKANGTNQSLHVHTNDLTLYLKNDYRVDFRDGSIYVSSGTGSIFIMKRDIVEIRKQRFDTFMEYKVIKKGGVHVTFNLFD